MSIDGAIADLVRQIEAEAPAFGRVEVDLVALVERARRGDYKGVLQNARLVAEALLRAIVVSERKETPGKLGLDQLLTKLGQTSVLPPHVAVHLRTIQAWGNLSAHDQADDLFAEGVKVERAEAHAALNALLVILRWYREKYLAAEGPSVHSRAGPRLATIAAAGGGVLVLAGIAAVAWFTALGGSSGGGRAALDAVYGDRSDLGPLPPVGCQATTEEVVGKLLEAVRLLAGGRANAARPEDKEAIALLEGLAEPEAISVRAKAHLHAGDRASAITDAERAISSCPRATLAFNILGSVRLLEGDVPRAKEALSKAAEQAPSWTAPRFNLALVALISKDADGALAALDGVLEIDRTHTGALEMRGLARMQRGDVEAAVSDLQEATRIEPSRGSAFAVLGQALEKLGRQEEAGAAFCKAVELGVEAAKARCPSRP